MTQRNKLIAEALGTFWLVFPEQWTDPKSPWADRRVRLAASLAIDRKAINEAETLGFSKITGSIIPHTFEGFWAPPAPVYDPAKAKQLLTEAGFPNGFDGGDSEVFGYRRQHENRGTRQQPALAGAGDETQPPHTSLQPKLVGESLQVGHHGWFAVSGNCEHG